MNEYKIEEHIKDLKVVLEDQEENKENLEEFEYNDQKNFDPEKMEFEAIQQKSSMATNLISKMPQAVNENVEKTSENIEKKKEEKIDKNIDEGENKKENSNLPNDHSKEKNMNENKKDEEKFASKNEKENEKSEQTKYIDDKNTKQMEIEEEIKNCNNDIDFDLNIIDLITEKKSAEERKRNLNELISLWKNQNLSKDKGNEVFFFEILKKKIF